MNPLTAIRDLKQTRHQVRPHREKPVQRYRRAVQIAFAALCIWIGVEFFFFVRFLESGGAAAFVNRPPGVEGFLPISSLMSLYYFFQSGQIHPAHPAGLFILVAIVVVSFVFGKAFCSWMCPVGFLSEMLGNLGDKIFGRKLKTPDILDYPLRSLKYLLLAFFVWAIFWAMNETALKAFLDSPYNQTADIKMYYFFADISRFAFIVIAALFALSIVVRNFWCRYLCPYGALLGILSLVSPHKIKRNAGSCIDCGRCAKACPSNIKVDTLKNVVSDECSTCLACVDSCPVADTLTLRPIVSSRRVPKKVVAAAIVLLFVAITGGAMIAGYWQNDITPEQYLKHQEQLHGYGHPTGASDIAELNEKTKSTTPSNNDTNEPHETVR